MEYSNISVLDWVTIGIKNVEDVNIAIMEKGQVTKSY